MPMACTPIRVFQAPQHLTAMQNLMHTCEYGNRSSQVWSEYNAHSTITKNTQFYELNVLYKIRPGFMQLEESMQILIYWPLRLVLDSKKVSLAPNIVAVKWKGLSKIMTDLALTTYPMTFIYISLTHCHFMLGHQSLSTWWMGTHGKFLMSVSKGDVHFRNRYDVFIQIF